MLIALRISLGLVLFLGAVWLFVPRERLTSGASFDPARLGPDLDGYLARQEGRFADIQPGVGKRIVWAGETGAKTPLAVVYVHGFSATSEEIRPVPDRVAEALGANLFFTRLAGHGRSADAMAEPRAEDWMNDMAEALAIGRRLGDEVLVIATSTGGTLATIAAHDPRLAEAVKGIVLVSPNYGLNSRAAFILSLPGVRHWGPLVAGRERSFAPVNEDHARYWTTRYPTEALFPMIALVDHALGLDHASARAPAMMLLSDRDRVIRVDTAQKIAAAWGARTHIVSLGPDDDPYAHVIAGDILSPSQTEAAVDRILEWVQGL